MTDMLDTENPLRQGDIQCLHQMLLEILMQSAAPSGRRELQAFVLLGECVQLLSAAAINLSATTRKQSIP
jgi:hypothetical protein